MNVEIMIDEIGGDEGVLSIKNVKNNDDQVQISIPDSKGIIRYVIVNIEELKHALRKITVK